MRTVASDLSADVFAKEHEEETKKKYDAKEQFDTDMLKKICAAVKEAI